MNILGINAYHGDSSACFIRDGQLLAAAQEERFRRIKHWAGLPSEAIKYCLCEAGLNFSQIHHIAINRNPGSNNLRRATFVLTHRPDWRLVLNRVRSMGKVAMLESALCAAFPDENMSAHVHYVEHHLAHMASAFLVSKFEEAVVVSVDGFGDFASAAWGMGRCNAIQVDGRVYFPHSLGIFYSALTQYLGFPFYGDEYKVMGLAPYGHLTYLEQMRQIIEIQSDGTYRLNLRFFCHHKENVAYSWNNCAPEVGPLYNEELEALLGPARVKGEELNQRHKDIARSVQAIFEEALFALLNALYKKYHCPNLALAGGCALNSVANGKTYQNTPFRKIYVPAAAGDAGGAIGAALIVWQEVQESGVRAQESEMRAVDVSNSQSQPVSTLNSERSTSTPSRFRMEHAYWGPQSTNRELEQLLKFRAKELCEKLCTIEQVSDPRSLCGQTARAISEGKVVGWFQGRMEWGPRALGNRSILCDPRRPDMKSILNEKIKRRESFRPFAPSILREAVAEWFETDDDVPFMMQVFQIRPEKRALIPAVTHVDGSGRLHTVCRDTHPLYHRLISEFSILTSVPLILNTSFNENEPVVCRPEEALDCFLRTRMEVLVLGNFYIARNDQPFDAVVIPTAKCGDS